MKVKDEKDRILDFQKTIHKRIAEYAKEKGLSTPDFQPIPDGVADISGYVSSNPKIMWVLKEPWGEEE